MTVVAVVVYVVLASVAFGYLAAEESYPNGVEKSYPAYVVPAFLALAWPTTAFLALGARLSPGARLFKESQRKKRLAREEREADRLLESYDD